MPDDRDFLFMADLFGKLARPVGDFRYTVPQRSINTVAPVISGTPDVGQVLSCTTGTWAFTPLSYLYQWRRDGAAIPGAAVNTYTLVALDTGTDITCAVTAINASGLSDPAVSNTLVIPPLDVPVNTVAPVISGTTGIGSTLTVSSNGTWDNEPTSYTYLWKRNGVSVVSGSTYLIGALDVGASIVCEVTASNANGASLPATSNTKTGTSGSEPVLELSANSIAENASIGTAVGVLSVTNGSGTYTYIVTVDASNKFTTVGSELRIDQALNYETATSHSVTVEADNGVDDPVVQAFTVNVTNVLEVTLAALTLSASTMPERSVEGTAVGNIVGASAGSTITMTDTATNRFKLTGSQVQAGATLTDFETLTSHNITLREIHADGNNSPRDTVLAISITNVADTLAALTLSADDIQEGSAENTVVGALVGLFGGSSLSMTVTAGNRFKLSGTNVVAGATPTDFATATSHSITVQETHASTDNSPRSTILTVNVTEAGAAAYLLTLGGVVVSTGSREMITLSGMVSEE